MNEVSLKDIYLKLKNLERKISMIPDVQRYESYKKNMEFEMCRFKEKNKETNEGE